MDPITRRRHARPDYEINLHATGVKLPDGRVSWRLDTAKTKFSSADHPEGLVNVWWAQLFADWAKSFLARGLQTKIESAKIMEYAT